MKKRFGLGLVVLLFLTLLPLPLTHAQDTMNQTEAVTTQSSESTNDEFEIDDTTATDFQKKLEERMAARKAAMTEKVTAYQQRRIAARCEAAQKVVTKVSDRAKEAKTNRDQVYSNILKSATKLRDRMKENGKDTTKLDTNIKELDALITTFKTDLKGLRQSAADITTMKCADDPTSFKASIEALRTAREAVAKDSEAIRAYIKDSLKPTLQEIRTSIGETKQEEGVN